MSKETVGCEIKIENVWKVFGNTDKDALDAIQNKNISSSYKKHRIAYETLNQKKYLSLNHSKFQIIYDNSVQKSIKENQIGMPWIEGLETTLNKPIIFPLP